MCQCVSVYMWVCTHECRCPRRSDTLDSPRPGVRVVVSHLMKAVGTKCWSSVRGVCTFNYGAPLFSRQFLPEPEDYQLVWTAEQ